MIFFAYCFALTLDELHQWIDDLRKGSTHFNDWKNVIDVGLWVMLTLANLLRIWAASYCSRQTVRCASGRSLPLSADVSRVG